MNSRTLLSRISRAERSLPRRIEAFGREYPWLDQAGVNKLAAACLDAMCAFYEVTRDSDTAGNAMLLVVRELAESLRDNPAVEFEPLQEFEFVPPEAEPRVNAILDRIGYRGPRVFPTATERRVWKQEHDLMGVRLLRPLPPGVERSEPRIKVPFPKEHTDGFQDSESVTHRHPCRS